MNLLLLQENQFESETCAYASNRQSEHIIKVLKLNVGDSITVGKLNGNIGKGIIQELGATTKIEGIILDAPPPPPLPVTLILGMPRPQMLKRILQTVSTMGVSQLHFIQTNRVEKSFWQSPSASDDAIHKHLILGLEQGMATQLPKVEKHLRFRPFMEDALDEIVKESQCYVADPGGEKPPESSKTSSKISIAIGPEGGFQEKEVAMFSEHGFTPIHLGKRILKVETAVPVLLAKLFPFQK